MRNRVAAASTSILLALAASAAIGQTTPALETDPLDLSNFEKMVEESDFVTISELEALEAEANAVFKSGDCDAALPIIKDYYKKTNSLSNLIRQGVEPYYGASYEDQKTNILGAQFDELVKAENTSNELIKKRNIAWVMEAECLSQTGDRDAAIASLYRALEYISYSRDERDLWKKARTLLWQQVQYQPE